jgi:hypothetical protein
MRFVLLLLLVGCTATRSSTPIAAGQWGLYKITDGDKVSNEQMRVVRSDGCGMWIERTQLDQQTSTTTCTKESTLYEYVKAEHDPKPITQIAGQDMPVKRWRFFLLIGFGTGLLTGGDDDDASATKTTVFQAGFEIKPGLELVADSTELSTSFSPDNALEESGSTFAAGVRWFPFGRPRRDHDLRGIYGQALVGFSILRYRPYADWEMAVEAIGALGTVAIGWINSWGLGIEAREQLSLYNKGNGLRHSPALFGFLNVTL